MEDRIVGFEPIWTQDARLLILGTMPSVESLHQSFYYAHPRNAFWPMMSEILNEELPRTIEQKREMLVRHHIALWDVAGSCVRPGSLDSSIRAVIPNDFEGLFRHCPKIEKILFNGATAQKLYEKHVKTMPEGCICAKMPSTSPAFTLRFECKLSAWREGMEGYYD